MDAIPEARRQWMGQAAPEAELEALHARLVAVWDVYMPEVSPRTQAHQGFAAGCVPACYQ
ncbi:MAG TPA: hypothetical protein VGC99_28755 [Candidatus Tectomicrobia bacterium]